VAPDRSPEPAAAPGALRSPARLRAELEDLRRYLAETPPHHGAGVRQALEARMARLERELAERDG
jgi:hypothetical protein